MQTKYLLLVLLPAITLIAITPIAFANNGVGAVVTKQDPPNCALVDPANPTSFELPGSLHDVITPSGNERITCKSTVDYNGPALHFDASNSFYADGSPLLCYGVSGLASSNWHEEVSGNGKVTLTCDITGATPP